MSATLGYTAKTAELLKHRIDRDMAEIESRVLLMGTRVTDNGNGSWFGQQELEHLRERVEELKAIIDRRTQRS